MSRYVYVNGRHVPYAQAAVHAEDRGNQFGDAIYEVCEVLGGRLVDETRHLDRLDRSLRELMMPAPMSRRSWNRVLREVIRRNRLIDGSLYIQVSRGARPREFLFAPAGTVPPTVIVIARAADRAANEARAEEGIGIVSMPDIRWARCDIKTVMLLPASLAKEKAKAEGAKEAWLVDDDGHVTEGASSNAWIITTDGRLVTRAPGNEILRGCTRMTLIELLRREGLTLEERPFTIAEAKAAREAFITSATSIVMPVVRIDGQSIGNGAPGLQTLRLRAAFHEAAEQAPA
jgi:D-alanine transaminase